MSVEGQETVLGRTHEGQRTADGLEAQQPGAKAPTTAEGQALSEGSQVEGQSDARSLIHPSYGNYPLLTKPPGGRGDVQTSLPSSGIKRAGSMRI